jgi:RHH-type proline utilization regulon transcriptional repressor/proline dehydrogenase/delta 1-pyrroline-5-carboxylate dehydrogenase
MKRSNELITPEERENQESLARLVRSPHDKVTVMKLTDQSFRSQNPQRVANQIVHLLKTQDIPTFLHRVDRTLMEIFRVFGRLLPGVSIPLVKKKVKSTSENMILAAEPEPLRRHLTHQYAKGIRVNINFLGEAVLGEGECARRLEEYMAALANPEIEVVSVKISTIYSQITPVAATHTVDVLSERLARLLEVAKQHTFIRPDGSEVRKFVYLDMEEYRDMYLTTEAFMKALDKPGMEGIGAGIALQAYIPDAFQTQKRINEWARLRVLRGGAPVTIRIVKGANLEMEKTEAGLRGWPQAPYQNKTDVDANYKRMLQEGLKPENIVAVNLGLASHNLFDLSYGLVLSLENDALDKVQVELLEGMADHICRALQEITNRILLYAPATKKENFISAIGYLMRRLDENTGPENFLSNSFDLELDTGAWKKLQSTFLKSFERIESLREGPRRTQDRQSTVDEEEVRRRLSRGFAHEPDTDFSLPANQQWAERIVEKWKPLHDERAIRIPLVVAGEEITKGRKEKQCMDPSRPGVVVGICAQATTKDIQRAVACAKRDDAGWRNKSHGEKAQVLSRVAMEIRRNRADLIGAAMAEGGKVITESDPEVSKAIDFLEYYTESIKIFSTRDNLECTGKGVVAVISPWNVPIAIPCGGVSAALAAGNTVILKPASAAALTAYLLCRCYWEAGVSRKTLQFLPCSGSTVGTTLVTHQDVDAVILTGGTATASQILKGKPDLPLCAETGGKNATIVTAMADRGQALKNLLHSAFGHAGQKCSATSLLILEEELYEDPKFKRQLQDAVQGLNIGSAWELHTTVGPLIQPPQEDLKKALETLEPGEQWLIEPRNLNNNQNLWSPGVKWDVEPGSHNHMTELLGPVLAVMKARDLDGAIDLVNMTGYGLTSGIETLDEREHEVWTKKIRAGNLYINRGTTGALVLRQPFGGMGKSSFGPGIKTGGPNYISLFMDFKEVGMPEGSLELRDPQLEELVTRIMTLGKEKRISPHEAEKIVAAARSYDLVALEEFFQMHDHFRLRGQDNFRRYFPVERIMIRLHRADTFFEILARICAAQAVGCRLNVSYPKEKDLLWDPALIKDLTSSWGKTIEHAVASDGEVAKIILDRGTDRVRYAAPDKVPMVVSSSAAETGIYIARAPVLMDGRVELMWYLYEQSISNNYHRYGNIGERGEEGLWDAERLFQETTEAV